MANSNIQMTIDWVLEMAKSGKPIMSDNIVPTLKEKGMLQLRDKLAKRNIQVWWSQNEVSKMSIILPRNIKTDIISRDGWKVGVAYGENHQVIVLPAMKA